MSHTRIGLPPTRLPASATRSPRDRLLDLAHRGIILLRLDRSEAARLIVHLCNGLAVAIKDLAVAESRLVAAAERIEELQLMVRQLEFGEPTRTHEPSSRSLRRLKPTAVVDVPGVE